MEYEIVDSKEQEVARKKKSFLESITSPEEQMILEGTIKRKELIAKEGKKKAKGIANITREMMEADYVKIDDDIGVTYEEMLGAKMLANMMRKQDLTPKDLSDLQKVSDGNTADVGIKIVFETNGQDLGD